MDALLKTNLNDNEKKALNLLKENLQKRYKISEIILYGSKARGDSEKESDMDVLVILENEVNDNLREEIFNLSFEIELEYDVIFGILIEQKDFWGSLRAKSMPIHWNIDREGITV
ncbi:MAG: nucleotidyltransferase domain-containing protein [Actinobacteria bacterium]|nr:nucleotidyltransferase domain-containing protein [Actinomycetota bacterium]MCG2788603.1 nucleotidyltransferase domain-containing protein [Actinomycetes bacterium]